MATGGAPAPPVRLADVATARKRVLIDWDWGAHGIWTILSGEDLAAPAPTGVWRSYEKPASEAAPRPWSDQLSAELLEALQEWNDRGERVFDYTRTAEASEEERDAFRTKGEELAARTQRELGPHYEVLFVTVGGAWKWVDPPWSRGDPR